MDEKQTGLSEFFSILSEEKVKTKKEFQDKLENPASDLVNLFAQLENALTETKKISENTSIQEDTEEKILSSADQNKLEVFSNLWVNMVSEASLEKPSLEVKDDFIEVVQDVLPVDEETEDVIEVSEIPEEIIKTDNVIDEIVNTLDEMGAKTEIKEEMDQISVLRRDFNNFKNLIQRDISNQKMSGAGSGEVRLEFLDDVNRDSVKVDGKVLQYRSSDKKWVGAASGNQAFHLGISELLEETDGDNIVFNATDSSSSDENDDILLERGVDGGRDFEHSVLQELTSNIIPQASGTYDLGSETKRFKNIYLSSETVNLGGATISSDGSGTITISADGATLPENSKDAGGNQLAVNASGAETGGVVIKKAPFFTRSGGLVIKNTDFEFNATVDNNKPFLDQSTFLLANGDSLASVDTITIWQF